MTIKEKEVLIKSQKMINFYRKKGYKIEKNKELFVKVEDLSEGSKVLLTKVCDICNKEVYNQSYRTIIMCRKKNKDKIDMCGNCGRSKAGKEGGFANEFNCIAITHPHLIELFWNIEDVYKYKANSHKFTDFKCPCCKVKVENKMIKSIKTSGTVPCFCKDGKSYPEKFIFCFLNQLNVEFDTEKRFNWSTNINNINPKLSGSKFYDFYLKKFNFIIETHGLQHYKESGKKRLRTLGEEQENDNIKKNLAIENKIKNYIILDCSNSNLTHIKNSILNSKLNELFDLSKIDWLKCHEFGISSFVKIACDLFNTGYSALKISELMKLNRMTIINYLKQGAKINLCNYDPKEESIKALKKGAEKTRKIIQLSLNGEFIEEFSSMKEAQKKIGNKCHSTISRACKNENRTAFGFRWKYKEDYISQSVS